VETVQLAQDLNIIALMIAWYLGGIHIPIRCLLVCNLSSMRHKVMGQMPSVLLKVLGGSGKTGLRYQGKGDPYSKSAALLDSPWDQGSRQGDKIQ